MTIETVDGNQVTGKGWSANSTRSFEWRFRGTVDGNRLIYTGGDVTVEFTIKGDLMEGVVRSTVYPLHTVILRKVK
jgi:hypothetical protein